MNVLFDTRRCMHCASPGLQRINLRNYAGLERGGGDPCVFKVYVATEGL